MAVEKPRNLREAALVELELRRKYPQMYQEGWGKVKKGKKVKAKSAEPASVRDRQNAALRDALTGEEMRRLMGR